jgi:putative FmdB family regulatory protein
MPIYEYQCNACNHQFDVLQKMSDAPLTDCPSCHKAALQKMMSATSFQLKGTGWYATDFKTKPKTETKVSNDATGEAASQTSTTADSAKAVGAETAATPNTETQSAVKTSTETKTEK